MKTVITLIYISFILLIQGCSNIPLSTMWKMKGFDQNDFNRIKPQQIRVKFRSDKFVDVTKKSLKLSIQSTKNKKTSKKSFALEQINSGENLVNKLFGSDFIEYYSILRLTPDSMKQFSELQKTSLFHQKKGETLEFVISFNFYESEPPSYLMSIDLLLNPEDSYFTLFDEVPFGSDNIQKLTKETSN